MSKYIQKFIIIFCKHKCNHHMDNIGITNPHQGIDLLRIKPYTSWHMSFLNPSFSFQFIMLSAPIFINYETKHHDGNTGI